MTKDCYNVHGDSKALTAGIPGKWSPEDLTVLLNRQQIKQNIMLRANSHKLTQLLRIIEHINAKHLSVALSRLVETGKRRDQRRLSCSVVPKEHKYLVCEHLNIDTIYCSHPIAVFFD